MIKTLQDLANYCTGKSNEEWVEVVTHCDVKIRRKVALFRSLPELTGIFVGFNHQGDGAVIRVQVEDVRREARRIAAALVETVEVI